MGKLIASILSKNSLSGDLLAPPMIAAVLTMLVGIFLLVDFIATFLSRMIDPRLRTDSEIKIKGILA
jgi:ABC-type dipeptide/oligopeptide/nickel transport system permease component